MKKLHNIYQRIKKLETDVLKIFNEEVGLRGITGLIGNDSKFENTICYLESIKNMLIAIQNKDKRDKNPDYYGLEGDSTQPELGYEGEIR